jgi:hypothetical protein
MRYHSSFSTKASRFCALSMLFISFALLSSAIDCHAAEIIPFYTSNQSPIVQIFGLPSAENARLTPNGRLFAQLGVAVASNFAIDDSGAEKITLDGETYRTTLALRYGIGKRFEVGLDVPYVAESGGFLDGTVEGFHDTFGLGAGGRDMVPHDRLHFAYTGRDGVDRFNINHANGGFGDIRLSGAFQLNGGDPANASAVALRGSIKMPTGKSGELHGSGSADFAFWLTAARDFRFTSSHLTLYGALGGMALTTGDVLPDQQRNLVAFGTVGMGWSPYEWLGLKLQFDANTPFYENSSLQELSVCSIQTVWGFTFAFTRNTALDIALSEDYIVNTTSPDFGFSLNLRTLI